MPGNEHDYDVSEHSLIGWLDSWRLAVAIAAVAFVAMALFSIKLWIDLGNALERLDAVVMQHQEDAKAANHETVNTCFANAAQGPVLRRVIAAFADQAQSAQTKEDLQEFRRLNELNTPTIRECRQLANRLNIPVPKGVGG